jgi:hypothetical protein
MGFLLDILTYTALYSLWGWASRGSTCTRQNGIVCNPSYMEKEERSRKILSSRSAWAKLTRPSFSYKIQGWRNAQVVETQSPEFKL